MNSIDSLSRLHTDAKANAAQAAGVVADIEAEIIRICGAPEEGAQTNNGEQYAITTTGKINRTIDIKALSEVAAALPAETFNKLFKPKPALDLKYLRSLQEHSPAEAAIAAKAITAKPGKPSIKIKELL